MCVCVCVLSAKDLHGRHLRDVHHRLGIARTSDLIDNLHCLRRRERPEVTVGTICSGTDACMISVGAVRDFWSQSYGVDCEHRHIFSCEKSEDKRRWLLSHPTVQPNMMFEDVKDIAYKETAYDCISGTCKHVPHVDVALGGTECDMCSTLNHSCATSHGCVKAGRGGSGETADGYLAYIDKTKPLICGWENVRNVDARPNFTGETDWTYVSKRLNKAGYATVRFALDTKDVGVPQSRLREWLFGFLVSTAAVPQEVDGWKSPQWRNDMMLALETTKVPKRVLYDLDDFLLDDGDWRVRRWLQQRNTIMAKKSDKELAATLSSKKYESEHLDCYMDVGAVWPAVMDDEFQRATGHLPRRQQECAWYHEQCISHWPEADKMARAKKQERLVTDLNQSLSWQIRPGWDHLGLSCCLVGSSRPWLVSKRRDMCGEECLALQGVPYHQQPDWPDNVLTIDLAGNSFNAFVIDNILTAICSAAPWDRVIN